MGLDEEKGRKEKKSVPKKTSEEKKLEKEQSMEDTELKQEFLAALVSLNQELTDLCGDCQGLHSGRDLFGASLMDAKWLEGITKLLGVNHFSDSTLVV